MNRCGSPSPSPPLPCWSKPTLISERTSGANGCAATGQNRIDGLPQPLGDLEASALAEWALLFDDDYGAAVDLVLASPASLPSHSNLPFALSRASKGFGPIVHLIEKHPENTARLAAHLLKMTTQARAQNGTSP